MKLESGWWTRGEALTVGSIGLAADIQTAASRQSDCDLYELRLDLLKADGHDLSGLHALPAPLLITARDAVEGGKGDLPLEERLELFQQFLSAASAIDVEIRNLSSAKDLIGEARRLGVAVIGSYHDFEKTPDEAVFMERIMEATAAGVDVIKFAAKIDTLADLQALCDVFTMASLPVAIMGMGSLGPVSRVLLAQHGSLLNYGFIGDASTAPGQWPARLLKEAIAHSPRR